MTDKAKVDALKNLIDIYADDKRVQTFNAIIYGDIGSGKTKLLSTCRRPILVHSFDPGGTLTLRKEKDFMKEGGIYVDTRYEIEDAKAPTAFTAWEKEFDKLRADKVFDTLGTYCIDSATTWADALMNAVLKRNGRAAGVPQQMDWMVQMNTIRDALKAFCALPCDCILTAHVDYDKDEGSGRMVAGPLLTGKLKQKIPLLFDELYRAVAQRTAKGTEYSLQTQADSMYRARTRLGTGGTFEPNEVPDITALLKKAGLR